MKNEIRDIEEAIDFQSDQFGGTLKTKNGQVKISSYTDQVIRVQVSNSEPYDTNPYSVVTSPCGNLFTRTEHQDYIDFDTESLRMRVQKSPVRICFYTSEGELLSEDDPGLGISFQHSTTTLYRKLQPGERFIGLGEKTGHLDRRGSGYINWNTDRFAYTAEQDPLYASIPFFIGAHQGKVYGIYLDNSYQSQFNFGASNNRFSSISCILTD